MASLCGYVQLDAAVLSRRASTEPCIRNINELVDFVEIVINLQTESPPVASLIFQGTASAIYSLFQFSEATSNILLGLWPALWAEL